MRFEPGTVAWFHGTTFMFLLNGLNGSVYPAAYSAFEYTLTHQITHITLAERGKAAI